MKDLDKFITDVVTKKINEPEEYEMAIRTAFDKHSYKKIHFNKIAVTICSLLILISGFAYATDIKEFISKYLYNFNKGVDTAIENGYFDETKTDYINSEKTETIINGISMDSYNTGIAVNNMLFDDYNLIISGHMHDGCVPFGIGKFKWGIVNPKKNLFPKNVRGIRKLKNNYILITGGITKIQKCAPKILHPLNHLCPMQLDVINVSNGDKFKIDY